MKIIIIFFVINLFLFQERDSSTINYQDDIRLTPIYFLADDDGSHFYHFRTIIYPNYRTSIYLTPEDSSYTYVLFDNLLETEKNLIIAHQDSLESVRKKYFDYIVIPLPKIDQGVYFLIYKYRSITHKYKFLYLN